MTRIPKLYETAADAREPDVTNNLAPLTANRTQERAELTARRRKIAGVVAAILLTPLIVKGAIDSYGYGYHPHNQATMQTETGH